MVSNKDLYKQFVAKGYELNPPPITCTKCYTDNNPTSNFCINCGKNFKETLAYFEGKRKSFSDKNMYIDLEITPKDIIVYHRSKITAKRKNKIEIFHCNNLRDLKIKKMIVMPQLSFEYEGKKKIYPIRQEYVDEFWKAISKQRVLRKKMKYITKNNEKEEIKINLEKTGNYKYIEKFATRYEDKYNSEEINKLNDLLTSKGIKISLHILQKIVDNEIEKQKYANFKEKMSYENITLKEETQLFLEIYGENYNQYIDYFKKLLQEKNSIHSDQEIHNIINQIKKEKDLRLFEAELLTPAEPGKSPFISVQDVDLLNGYQFECLLKLLFEKMGYKVVNTPLSGDQGADLILNRFSEKIVVQAKRYSDNVPNKAVQEVVASVAHYNADKGVVVTNSNFTASAIELANSNEVKLINRDILNHLFAEYPIKKEEFLE